MFEDVGILYIDAVYKLALTEYTTKIATFIAVCLFNKSFVPILKMLTFMEIKIDAEAHLFAVKHDNIRVERSEIRASEASEEARTARLEERTTEIAFF
ncbi:hypothetical protein TNCT_517071 [Trichonephila clavata]|uniref:Uncharacterized protein n=1 Tax=Trichonephila clavata TaxID=2740835 RepID=A0A8X6IAX1_TRICU|nr:hypothetical protein TNCT_517071 [Trichonephila clavata]